MSTRTTRKLRRFAIVDHQIVIRRRRQNILAELADEERKLTQERRAVSQRKSRINVLRGQLDECARIERELDKERLLQSKQHVVEAIDGAKYSHLIMQALRIGPTEGRTVAELANFFPDDVRRATLSATLYNLKRRGDVVHNEATGRYRLTTPGLSEHDSGIPPRIGSMFNVD